jgi:tyrosine-specific transport protein
MLLVAGSCIGAGMLALPILTGLAGFFPSFSMMILSWGLMTFTGLLLVEASGWFYGQTNLLSMVEESLGKKGRTICWVSYLFLFYSLLVAYTAASGSIFAAILDQLFHWAIPAWGASTFFTLFFGVIVYLGTRPVDLFNRWLMAGLIITYLGMIGVGITHVQPSLLVRWAPSWMISSLPVLVVSFGFQNVIPSLTAYMRGDLRRMRRTILGGSLITLAVYLIWSILVLGVVPFDGPHGLWESYQQGEAATIALHTVLGSSWLSGFAQGFAFFAIVTSFLAQGLTLTHFLADGFKTSPEHLKGKLFTILALIPPLLFALLYPTIFFQALSFAGGICAMILFGILPVWMIWVGRYRKGLSSNYHVHGGKSTLLAALGLSLFVIGCEVFRLLGM